MALYVLYDINVKDNASFSHFESIPNSLKGLLASTAFFLGVYLIWFVITVLMTCIYIRQIPFRSRIMFIYSIMMLMICLGTIIFGVYSPLYSNGGIILFFIAIFNIYVWSLVYLNWPSKS